MTTPMFSIVTPAGRDARGLASTIAAVRQDPWIQEHFVVAHDGSVSRSEISRREADLWQWLDPPLGEAARDPINPLTAAVNRGLRFVRGEFVAWLHPGDIYYPETLSYVADFFQRQPEIDVAFGDAVVFDDKGQVQGDFRTPVWRRGYLSGGFVPCRSSVFLRRRIIEQYGPLNEFLRHWADAEYWLRLEAVGIKFGQIPVLLNGCRNNERRDHMPSEDDLAPLPHYGSLEALAELFGVFQRYRERVPIQWLVHEGRVRALVENGSARRGALKFALNSSRCLNGTPTLSKATLRLLSHFFRRSTWRSREPEPWLNRWLPASICDFLTTYCKRRIFKLRHHQPRPTVVPSFYRQSMPPRETPTISIVTPNLNQGRFLEATLRSVLDQSYPRLEFVVQDGGSTDESRQVLESYAARLHHCASEPDRGQAQAINRGMRHTSGEIMAYLNSDDLLLPGSLAFVANFFHEHSDVDAIYGHRVLIDEIGNEIGRWVLPPHDDGTLRYADYVPQETLFWRRRILDLAGGAMDESFQFAMDWDLLLRFRAAGAKFVRVPRFLGAFRISAEQKSRQQLLSQGRREMDRLRRRTLGHFPTSREINRNVRRYVARHWWWDKLYLTGVIRH